MNMRKLVIWSVLAISLLLPQGLVSAAYHTDSATVAAISEKGISTNVKLSEEQAIDKLLRIIPSLKDAKVEYADLIQDDSYNSKNSPWVWNIQWNNRNVSSSEYNAVTTQLDANTGELHTYYNYTGVLGNEAFYPPKISYEQAKERAIQFIIKASPSLSINALEVSSQYQRQSSQSLFGPVHYSFYFNLKRNGLVTADSISTIVDSNGEIIQYHKSVTQADYPSATPKISRKEAQAKLTNLLKVQLNYIPVYKKDVIDRWILGWTIADDSVFQFDANSGKSLNYNGEVIVPVAQVQQTVPATKNMFQPRSGTSELTYEEAVAIVKKVVTIPKGRSLTTKTLEKEDNYDRKVWNLIWEQPGSEYTEDYPIQTVAIVDAITGQILDYRIDNYGVGEEEDELPIPAKGTKLTKETARKQAYEWINLLLPKSGTDFKLVELKGEDHYDKEEGVYNYRFMRYMNDIPVMNSLTSIYFDQYGRLLDYYGDQTMDLDKLKLSSEVTVSKETALHKYISSYDLKLKYSRYGGYSDYNGAYLSPINRLVYEIEAQDVMQYNKVIDANSGEWVTIYDDELFGVLGESTANKVVDVKGITAEEDLKKLIEYGIITLDDDFRAHPNEQITLGEWLHMLAKAVNPYIGSYYDSDTYADYVNSDVSGVKSDHPYYNVVGFAAYSKWIDVKRTIQIDAKLTREELATILTSFVKYDKMAVFLKQDVLLSQFSDVSSIQNPGAVALCIKLGLLQGQNGKFNPKGTVTRAEAATIIMNLVKLQGQTDQAIGRYNY